MKQGKKIACIGDNCIDIYSDGTYYLTGNVVDTAVHLALLNQQVSMITTVANDVYGKDMLNLFKNVKMNTDHVKVVEGKTAITMMSMEGNNRVHGEYMEGVLDNMLFNDNDASFLISHDLIYSALWGKAEKTIIECKKCSPNILVAFDFADRLDHPLVKELEDCIDIGFYSYDKDDEWIRRFLVERRSKGNQVCVATLGENGSLVYDGTHFTTCGIYETTVVNTVGAGDSFIAGFIDGYLRNKTIRECCERGAWLASKVISMFEPFDINMLYHFKKEKDGDYVKY